MNVIRSEACGRVVALMILILTAVLNGTNKETKILFQVLKRTASFQSVDVFVLQFYVDLVAAAYNLFQLIRCVCFDHQRLLNKAGVFSSSHLMMVPWLTFLFDQMAVYLVLGTNCASIVAGAFAITGNRAMQWQTLCNVYTRFCVQAGSFLFFGLVASIVMAFLSSISAYNLFRFYSPNKFLALKTKCNNTNSSSCADNDHNYNNMVTHTGSTPLNK